MPGAGRAQETGTPPGGMQAAGGASRPAAETVTPSPQVGRRGAARKTDGDGACGAGGLRWRGFGAVAAQQGQDMRSSERVNQLSQREEGPLGRSCRSGEAAEPGTGQARAPVTPGPSPPPRTASSSAPRPRCPR